MISRWRPALRIARRAAWRAPGRTLLIAALIGLPVMAASWFGVVLASTNPAGETLATQEIGTADAAVLVTSNRAIRPGRGMMGPTTSSYDLPNLTATPDSRDPATVNVKALLPAGTRIAQALSRSTDRVAFMVDDGVIGTYPVLSFEDGGDLTKGTYRLDDGRLPGAATEVALTPALAKHLGVLDGNRLASGAAISTADGARYPVVGLARPIHQPGERQVWAARGSKLASIAPGTEPYFLVDLPPDTDLTALRQRLGNHGVLLTPRAWIVDPPENPDAMGLDASDNLTVWAAQALVIGFGVLEIVLLAGTAFAVGARRQTRELGLVTASGGTPTDVRRVVLAQGVVLGLIGAAGGVGIAILVAVLGRPWWETMMGHLIDSWRFPVLSLAIVAAIGLFAGLCAAIVPAVTAGRQTPLAALTGRSTVASGNNRIRRLAIVLVIAGVGSVITGTSRMAAAFAEEQRRAAADPNGDLYGTTPTVPISLVVVGITAVVAGLVWMLPSLVGKAGALGRALPLSGRLALRDAARHRHRTGPAAAAIMMSVGGTAAIAFAFANSFAAEAESYMPQGHHGDAVVRFAVDTPVLKPYSPATVTALASALPVKRMYEVADVGPPGAKPIKSGDHTYMPVLMLQSKPCNTTAQGVCGTRYYQLRTATPELLERLGAFGPAAAEALRTGKVVAPGDRMNVVGGRVRLVREDGTLLKGPGVPVFQVADLPRVQILQSSALVSMETARKIGAVTVSEVHFELTREPTEAEIAAANRILGSEEILHIERGYQDRSNATMVALIGAAAVVTLLGVAIAVALSAAEGRADLATLGAIGAPPRRRRSLAAAQAWVVGEIGCLLGVLVGALYGYPSHASFGSPHFVVPWRELAGIVIVVPLFAALLAWLLTRSRLPMVRRIE